MSLKLIGAASGVEVDSDIAGALKAVCRPIGTTLGHYRVSVVTGTLAAALAANAQIVQFKNTIVNNVAVVYRLRARILPLTPFTLNTLTDHTSFDAVKVLSYAAGGGGTTLTLTDARLRTSMAAAQSVINVSTTAALTLATTLAAHPFSQSIRKGNRVNPAAATEETIQPMTDGLEFAPCMSDGESPLILAQNEGFVIRNRTVWPAAGTGVVLFELAWVELLATAFP